MRSLFYLLILIGYSGELAAQEVMVLSVQLNTEEFCTSTSSKWGEQVNGELPPMALGNVQNIVFNRTPDHSFRCAEYLSTRFRRNKNKTRPLSHSSIIRGTLMDNLYQACTETKGVVLESSERKGSLSTSWYRRQPLPLSAYQVTGQQLSKSITRRKFKSALKRDNAHPHTTDALTQYQAYVNMDSFQSFLAGDEIIDEMELAPEDGIFKEIKLVIVTDHDTLHFVNPTQPGYRQLWYRYDVEEQSGIPVRNPELNHLLTCFLPKDFLHFEQLTTDALLDDYLKWVVQQLRHPN